MQKQNIIHNNSEGSLKTFQVLCKFSQKPLWCSGKATLLVNQGSWVQSRASPVLLIVNPERSKFNAVTPDIKGVGKFRKIRIILSK